MIFCQATRHYVTTCRGSITAIQTHRTTTSRAINSGLSRLQLGAFRRTILSPSSEKFASLYNTRSQLRMMSSGSTWDDNGDGDNQKLPIRMRRQRKAESHSRSDESENAGDGDAKTFREDFQGTRVFVQGLPSHTTWQDLKDHFKIAGEVVFASVSVDSQTGISKGCGVVQYETTDMARIATKIMRDYPLDGETLYVREDRQEQRKGPSTPPRGDRRRTRVASVWRCADEEEVLQKNLSEEDAKRIIELVQARDAARRRKDYDLSDSMREELNSDYGVHLDDRLKLWWVHREGGGVPDMVSEIKGDGRWGAKKPWRQIPTTLESDACVNPDMVSSLLKQRDIAREEKDFRKADTLLEEARNAPGGGLTLKINDETRSWRVWTPEKPSIPTQFTKYNDEANVFDQCISIVSIHDPNKVDEVKNVLGKFPGKESIILEKLKSRYNLR